MAPDEVSDGVRRLQYDDGSLFTENGANGWAREDKRDYDRKEMDNLGALLFEQPPFDNPDKKARCLEVGSSSGQLIDYFAELFPQVLFQPSEFSGMHGAVGFAAQMGTPSLKPIFASITEETAKRRNVKKPIEFDPAYIMAFPWEAKDMEGLKYKYDVIFASKLLHKAPKAVSEGIFATGKKMLVPGGHLYLYGPFKNGGKHVIPDNAKLDAQLRKSNPLMGLRDAWALHELAEEHGFQVVRTTRMPDGNLFLSYRLLRKGEPGREAQSPREADPRAFAPSPRGPGGAMEIPSGPRFVDGSPVYGYDDEPPRRGGGPPPQQRRAQGPPPSRRQPPPGDRYDDEPDVMYYEDDEDYRGGGPPPREVGPPPRRSGAPPSRQQPPSRMERRQSFYEDDAFDDEYEYMDDDWSMGSSRRGGGRDGFDTGREILDKGIDVASNVFGVMKNFVEGPGAKAFKNLMGNDPRGEYPYRRQPGRMGGGPPGVRRGGPPDRRGGPPDRRRAPDGGMFRDPRYCPPDERDRDDDFDLDDRYGGGGRRRPYQYGGDDRRPPQSRRPDGAGQRGGPPAKPAGPRGGARLPPQKNEPPAWAFDWGEKKKNMPPPKKPTEIAGIPLDGLIEQVGRRPPERRGGRGVPQRGRGSPPPGQQRRSFDDRGGGFDDGRRYDDGSRAGGMRREAPRGDGQRARRPPPGGEAWEEPPQQRRSPQRRPGGEAWGEDPYGGGGQQQRRQPAQRGPPPERTAGRGPPGRGSPGRGPPGRGSPGRGSPGRGSPGRGGAPPGGGRPVVDLGMATLEDTPRQQPRASPVTAKRSPVTRFLHRLTVAKAPRPIVVGCFRAPS